MKEIIRIPVTTQVVSSIKESIIDGQFAVNERLPAEAKLCEMLHVSRSSIREAMRVLQAEGYVELEAGRGAVVRDNQSHDYNTVRKWFGEFAPKLEDFTDVREVLEPLAVKLSIERGNEQEFAKLLEIHRAFIEADKEHNVSLLATLDEQFHTQIAIMTHNTLLEKITAVLNDELKKYRVMSISAQSDAKKTIAEHRMICDAIKAKDIPMGMKAMLDHLKAVRIDINSLL